MVVKGGVIVKKTEFIVSLCHLIVAEHVAEETNELLT